MSAEDALLQTKSERLRTLVNAAAPSGLAEPRPEWVHHPDTRPWVVLRHLWAARGLIRSVAERNLRVRYKEAVLGAAWSLLNPIGLLVAFTLVFHRAAKVNTGHVPYPLYAFLGLIPWLFFANCVSNGASSILADKSLLNKNDFPREVFPLGAVVVAIVDSSMATVALAGLFVLEGYAPRATAPVLLVPLLVLLVLVIGMALTLSAIAVHARDILLSLPLILQLGLFASPIGYPFDRVPGQWQLLYSIFDPVAPVIDSLRRTILLGTMPNWEYLGAAAAVAVTLVGFGYTLFKRLEPEFVDVA